MNKLLQKILIITIVFMATTGCVKQKESQKKSMFDKFENTTKISPVFRIESEGKFYGTAFSFCPTGDTNKKIIVTADHVATNILNNSTNQIHISSGDISINISDTITPRPSIDISFLKIKNTDILKAIPCIKPATELKTEHAEVYSYNYSLPDVLHAKRSTLSKGYILSARKSGIYVQLNSINNGSSGSPVQLLDNDKLIGIIVRKVTDKNTGECEGVSFAISIDDVMDSYHTLADFNNEWLWWETKTATSP